MEDMKIMLISPLFYWSWGTIGTFLFTYVFAFLLSRLLKASTNIELLGIKTWLISFYIFFLYNIVAITVVLWKLLKLDMTFFDIFPYIIIIAIGIIIGLVFVIMLQSSFNVMSTLLKKKSV